MRLFCTTLAVAMLALPLSSEAQVPQTAAPLPSVAASPAEGPQGSTSAQMTMAPGEAPAPALAMINSERYLIGADDSLQVTIWKEPTLSGTLPVRPDGMISLVLAGDILAAGKTPMQLAADIALRLKKYVQDPVVSVVVLAVNSQKVFILGEVGHVGAVVLSPGMTPLQAIAAAGGLSTFANAKRIYILRGVGNKQQKIPFNYKKALKGENGPLVSLMSGDTIVVP